MDIQQYSDEFKEFFKKAGVYELSEERQEKFIEDFFGVIHQRVSLRLADVATPEQREQLESIDTSSENALDALRQIYPNFGDIYLDEVEVVKRDMLSLMRRA